MKYVQLKSLRDLVMLVASSPSSNVIQHLENESEHLYFVIGGTLTEVFLYFVKEKEQYDGGFIILNSYTGEITHSDKILHEPNVNSIPLLEIKNQDVLSEKILEKVVNL